MSQMQPEFCYTFRDFDGVFKIGEGIDSNEALYDMKPAAERPHTS